MVKRRTLDDALNTEALAFYATGEKSRHALTHAPSLPTALPTAQTAIPERPLEASPPEDRTSSASKRSAPLTFVGLNTRVSPATKRALKKAAMERELDRIEPFSLQEIVDEAVADWLRKEGHLKQTFACANWRLRHRLISTSRILNPSLGA